MVTGRFSAALRGIRNLGAIWHRTALALGGLLLVYAGSFIRLPGLNGGMSGRVLSRGESWDLLTLYDRFASGATSRGAVLALGIMPYLSARIFVRLARVAFPGVGRLANSLDGQRKLSRWTRILTVGVALIQSYGLARFAQSIPGFVTQPGPGFIVQTMVILTSGAVFTMWLSDRITGRDDSGPVRPEAGADEIEMLEPGVAAPVSVPVSSPIPVAKR